MKSQTTKREQFLTILSSVTPEEITELIMENPKRKIITNAVIRIKK